MVACADGLRSIQPRGQGLRGGAADLARLGSRLFRPRLFHGTRNRPDRRPARNQTEEQWRAELATQMDHATGAEPAPEIAALPYPALQPAALDVSQETLPAAKTVEAEESPADVEELAMLAGSVA